MGAGDLSAALWQERRQLEALLFRMETLRLHVGARNLHWLGLAAAEVEGVLDRLRFDALARSVESAVVAAEWDVPAEAPLAELIAAAPPGPWAGILGDHLTGLQDLHRRLGESARAVRGSLRDVRQAIVAGAGPAGSGDELDQLTLTATLDHAVAVIGRTAQPHLNEYLGNGSG